MWLVDYLIVEHVSIVVVLLDGWEENVTQKSESGGGIVSDCRSPG